jgi:hypothetical protein
MNARLKSFITLLILCSSSFFSVTANKYNFPTGTSIVHNEEAGIILIKPKNREITFNPSWETAQDLGIKRGASIIINAWYFGYADSKFAPAWAYTLDNNNNNDVLFNPSHCQRDVNLCSFVNTTSLTIHRKEEQLRWSLINSWPILLKDNIINPDIYANNSHRNRSTYRTILINSPDGPYFLLTSKRYTLPRITHMIKRISWPTITAINLDGWSSTSIWTSQSDIYFNDHKRLPTYFVMW